MKEYRGVTWENDADLSRKLGKANNYVCHGMYKGKSREQIIDHVLDTEMHSYKGISWITDRELSIKLGKNSNYVLYYIKTRNMTHEQIIDHVLNNNMNKKHAKFSNPGEYRGITWENDTDLSRKLGMGRSYVNYRVRVNKMTREQIIDEVLDNNLKAQHKFITSGSYRNITWINNTDLAEKLGISVTGLCYYLNEKNMSREQVIDYILDRPPIKEKSYRGYTWNTDRELSIKLGKVFNYVAQRKIKGLSCEQIIDRVLDGFIRKDSSYGISGECRGITWKSDRDLSRKLGMKDEYVNNCKMKGLSYEQIIDRVLNPKTYSYRGITWINDYDLSRKLGKNEGYVSSCRYKGKSYEEIIDYVLEPKQPYSYRGITWVNNSDLSRKLGKYNDYVKNYKAKGLSCEQIIDRVLDEGR